MRFNDKIELLFVHINRKIDFVDKFNSYHISLL